MNTQGRNGRARSTRTDLTVVVPLPRAGSYALLTRPPLETPLPVRLACVKHIAFSLVTVVFSQSKEAMH